MKKPDKVNTWFVDDHMGVVHGLSGLTINGTEYLRKLSKFFAKAADYFDRRDKARTAKLTKVKK